MPFAAFILSVFFFAACAPLIHRALGDRTGKVLAIVPLLLFSYFLTLLPEVSGCGGLLFSLGWVPVIDLNLNFFVDGLSLLFLLIISLIGTLVVLYAQAYLKGSAKLGRFYLALFIFMGAMLGVVSSDNILALFVFWELTSLSSYLLIGYYHEKEKSRKAALQALLVTGTGGIVMLAGLILLGNAVGTYSISEMIAINAGSILLESGYYLPVLICLLIGAFTKSAQFPFHFWLPNAMEAPAPVSSYLHSATMVKAGVFLLARLFPILAVDPLWFWIVTPIGALTLITGVWLGLGQSDLKKILAYTTVAVLGTLVLLLGIGTELAVKAAMAYLLAHALYKGALFMASGAVDHESGCREVEKLSGMRKVMPKTALGAGLAALSMCGIPLLLGFLSKEYFYKAILETEVWGLLWIIIAVGGSALMFALAVTAGIRPYWGRYIETPKHAHDGPWNLWLGPVLLGGLGLVFAFIPGWLSSGIIAPATRGVIGNPLMEVAPLVYPTYIDKALLLSILTVILGIGVFLLGKKLRSAQGLYQKLAAVGPESIYFAKLNGMLATASWQTQLFQHGRLRYYVMTIALFAMALIALAAYPARHLFELPALTPIGIPEMMVCIVIIGATFLAMMVKSRLAAIAALGVVGLGIALLFLIFSAIDLALTQVLVETLAVILFVLAFFRLPKFTTFSPKSVIVRDALIATVFGIFMGGLALFAYGINFFEPISAYFAEFSYTQAYGRNVVNVILVDFRAIDTLGELVVLAIAAVGVFALLKLVIKPAAREEDNK